MQTIKNNIPRIPFSFIEGLMHFFGFEHNRLQEAKKIIIHRTGQEALNEDWLLVGQDMGKSLEKAKTEKLEEYACEQE